MALHHKPCAMERLSRALHSTDPADAIFELARLNGAPTSLRQLGMTRDMLDCAADIVAENPHWNPRSIERGAIRGLLGRAWKGEKPNRG
jgi:maleylacetate reductase